MRAPLKPGLPARDQFRAGRAELLTTTFETFERKIRDQLGRALGGGGFDPARDIEAITVNRWPHGYAAGQNTLYDPDWSDGELPWIVGRRRFGRIPIANSDAGAVCLTQAAFEQSRRAVQELVTDVMRRQFLYPYCRRSSDLIPEQAIDLDDERPVREYGKAARRRVALLVVDDEQLAAGTVFPAQPRRWPTRCRAGVVLQQRAREHQRRHRVGRRASRRERVVNDPFGEIHPVERVRSARPTAAA